MTSDASIHGTQAQAPRQLRPVEVKRLNREWRRGTTARLALLLDSVAQPYNVGSIIRSAAAFGAESLWLCGTTAPLAHPSVAKTALGTQRFLVAQAEPDAVAAVRAAQAQGLRVVAIELAGGAVPLHEAPLGGDVCLAIGNEDRGCSAALLAAADAVAYIPQPSRVGSLNVAAAAAVAMAEARRREWAQLSPWVHRTVAVPGNTRVMSVPYLDNPRPLAFAHRGGSAHALENSWSAFEHAVSLGYTYLETDARATADGELMAFHDRTLDRVTDARGPIGALSYAETAAIRVGGTEPIPRIEDMIGAWPDVRFNIDLKDEHGISLLPCILRRTGSWDRVCVTSFSGARLRTFRRLSDHPVCMAVSPASVAAVKLTPGWSQRRQAKRLHEAQAWCAQVPGRVANATFIRKAHALGLDVHAWTINDKTEMRRLLDLGVDGIMTDQVAMLRDVLTERGQWHPRDLAQL